MNLNEKIFSLYENILSKKSLILEQSDFVEGVPSIPGIDEMVWNKSPYNYDRGRMDRGLTWGGHDGHIHFGFTTPETAIAVIKKTKELGLHAGENPYSDDVQPVHTNNSFHYREFPGLYDGKKLGQGLDVSGNKEKMIELYNWVVTQIGGGQPVPFVAPDSGTGTQTSSPLDFLENLPDNAVETLKNVGIGTGAVAAAYGAYKLATANKRDTSTSPTSLAGKSDAELGIHSKFVYGGDKEAPFLAENLNEQVISRSLGKDVKKSGDYMIIPKDSNSQAISPVRGKVDNNKRGTLFSCRKKTDIYFEDEKFFLRYCGLENPVSNGANVNIGSIIGDVNQDVKVYLYDKNGSSKTLSNYVKTETQKTPETYQTRQKSSVLSKQYQAASINSKPVRQNVAASSQKLGGAPIQSRSYSKVSLVKELAENISKIKKLL